MSGAHGRSPSPARSRPRRIARLLGWNALVLFVLLALAAGGAEAYLRLDGSASGETNVLPTRLVPGVGVIRPPHAEIRYGSGREFRQISRANGLGFVDREPPDAARAAASCHVTLFGDSFVEALEVPIADKAQVRLEELAAREAPELAVTTSAFGHRGTAQINQLAFYDAYARPLSPDVVVLVAIRNDFEGNSLPLQAWRRGFHPDHPPWLFARPGADGAMEFAPPAASLEALEANLLSRVLADPDPSRPTRVERELRGRSRLADWLWRKLDGGGATPPGLLARAEWLSRRPAHSTFMRGWDPEDYPTVQRLLPLFHEENPPPVVREALDATRFALEQFRERAERDGAALVVFADRRFGGEGSPWFELLREIAAGIGEGIPVISQYDHIVAVDGKVEDGIWANDGHWNATGHRWAAEAIWEWLKANPEVCD